MAGFSLQQRLIGLSRALAASLALAILACLPVAAGARDTARELFTQYALQADVAMARRATEREFPDADYHRIVGYRFDNPPELRGTGLVDSVDHAYRQYWYRALLNPSLEWLYQWALRARITHALIESGEPWDMDVGKSVEAALHKRGIRSITQRTSPLLDFIAWRTQTKEHIDVALSDGQQSVPVVFVSDLVNYGWMDFATIGHVGTGGWIDDGTVFCIEEQYERASERFIVSFLKHEARHRADLTSNPETPAITLEYRARLTELVHATSTLNEVLQRVMLRADADGPSVHSRADHRVLLSLRNSIQCVTPECSLLEAGSNEPERIRSAARQLLQAGPDRSWSAD